MKDKKQLCEVYMRILVMSDSHGRKTVLQEIIERHPEADTVLFLGDGARQFFELREKYPHKQFVAVCGNNDFFEHDLKTVEILTVKGVKIFMAHGYTFNIRIGNQKVIEAAKKIGAKIVLCGHTHVPKVDYTNGVYYLNPGSVSLSRSGPNSYAVIDIEDNSIVPTIMKV